MKKTEEELRIALSKRIEEAEERLRDTLAREMCPPMTKKEREIATERYEAYRAERRKLKNRLLRLWGTCRYRITGAWSILIGRGELKEDYDD